MAFAKLNVLTVAVPVVAVSDPGAGSGETPVTKIGTGPLDDACVHVGQMQTVKVVRGSQDAIISKVGQCQAVQKLIT